MRSPFKNLLAVVASAAAFSATAGMQAANAQAIPDGNFADACNADGLISAVGSFTEFLDFQAKSPLGGCLLGDKLFTITDTTGLRLDTTTISISKLSDLLYTVVAQDSAGFQLGAKFAYTATITDPNIGQNGFDGFALDASSAIFPSSSQDWSVTATSPDFGPIVVTKTDRPKEVFLNLTQPTITVSNEITKAILGPQQLTNSFQQKVPSSEVPGPTPLLGAAAAFGFSRKLRTRIKIMA